MKNTITEKRKSLYGENRWQRTAIITMVVGLLFLGGCKTPYYTPIESHTNTSVKDSVALVIKDSVRITEKSVFKDYKGLLDTLVITGQRSRLKAWNDIDTTKGIGIINAQLEEDPVIEKTRIIFKDRWKVRDSLVYVEVPVPAPAEIKEIEVIPKFWRIAGLLGIIETLLVIVFLVLRLKKTGFDITKIFKIFKKQ